jgi:PIN domain nuclease of toxin-antitoxin system
LTLALLREETGEAIVNALLEQAMAGEISIFIHAVNLCEVYYDRLRSHHELEQVEQQESIPFLWIR